MDLSPTILAKSDQLNAADLAQPITARIAGVGRGSAPEQPVDVRLDGIERVWRPCKTARRILVAMWGSDGRQYVGRWIRLYCDPDVQWGGQRVGGIRISGASDIPSDLTVSLPVARGKHAVHHVERLQAPTPTAPPIDVQAKIAAGEAHLGPERVSAVRASLSLALDVDPSTLGAESQRGYLQALAKAAKAATESAREPGEEG